MAGGEDRENFDQEAHLAGTGKQAMARKRPPGREGRIRGRAKENTKL